MDAHEADAAALRRAFNAAIATYPQHLCQFISKDAEKAFRAWWGQFYEAIRDTTAGLKLLAELARLTERDALRRLELADTDAALADAEARCRALADDLADRPANPEGTA